MRSRKNKEWKMQAVQEGKVQVWVLTRGGETIYCWPKNGLTSYDIALARLRILKAKG